LGLEHHTFFDNGSLVRKRRFKIHKGEVGGFEDPGEGAERPRRVLVSASDAADVTRQHPTAAKKQTRSNRRGGRDFRDHTLKWNRGEKRKNGAAGEHDDSILSAEGLDRVTALIHVRRRRPVREWPVLPPSAIPRKRPAEATCSYVRNPLLR